MGKGEDIQNGGHVDKEEWKKIGSRLNRPLDLYSGLPHCPHFQTLHAPVTCQQTLASCD